MQYEFCEQTKPIVHITYINGLTCVYLFELMRIVSIITEFSYEIMSNNFSWATKSWDINFSWAKNRENNKGKQTYIFMIHVAKKLNLS
jgi:hypothetical protein